MTLAPSLQNISDEQYQALLLQLSPEERETLSDSYEALRRLDRDNWIDTFFPERLLK